MKTYLLLLLAFWVCFKSLGEKKPDSHPSSEHQLQMNSDSVLMVKLVHDFFDAFDQRDTDKINQLLLSRSVIIHHDGVETSRDQLLEIMTKAKNWTSRKET